MAQSAADVERMAASVGRPDEFFNTIFGKYARRDGAKLVIEIEPEDMTNIGELVVRAVFGYLLNKNQQAGFAPATALAAVNSDSSVRG